MSHSILALQAKNLLKRAQNEFQQAVLVSNHSFNIDMQQALYPQLTALIQHLQAIKYPNPPYTAKKFNIVMNNEEIAVTYIKTEKDIQLDEQQRQHIAAHALLIRELTLADTLAKYAASHLSAKQSVAVNKAIKALLEQEMASILTHESIKPLDTYAHTNQFIAKLANILMDNSNLSRAKAIKKIKEYERYVVSENNIQQVTINESVLDGQSIIQMDIPLSGELTKTQRNEYLRIFEKDNQPAWFTDLSEEEQNWYYQRVPRDLNDHAAWAKFGKINKTSAMQQSLENKNARQHYLIKNGTIIAESTKVATINPIEANKAERQHLTELNAEQLVEHLLNNAETDFKRHWGIAPDDTKFKIKPLLFIHSLLSPLSAGLADSKIIKGQQAALKMMAQLYSEKCKLIYGNDAVNILRRFDNQSANWKHTDKLIKYAKNLLLNLPNSKLTPELLELNIVNSDTIAANVIPDFVYFGSRPDQFQEQKKNIKLMVAAIAELEKLRNLPERDDRNKAAFKAAYQGLLVEAMGGKISSNCKSGKDRTGLDEIYRNTMRIYFEKYGKLPGYNDGPYERQQFTEIFQHLFNTLKIHEAAANNTPGSFGIKDSAKMLCKDLAAAIGADYKASNKRANLNKTQEKLLDKVKHEAATFFKNGINFLGSTLNKAFNSVLGIIGLSIKQNIRSGMKNAIIKEVDSVLKIYFDWKQDQKDYIMERYPFKAAFAKLELAVENYSKAVDNLELLRDLRIALGQIFENTGFHKSDAPHIQALHQMYNEISAKIRVMEKTFTAVEAELNESPAQAVPNEPATAKTCRQEAEPPQAENIQRHLLGF